MPKNRNNKRPEPGLSCVDKTVRQKLASGPYRDDESAADFFGMGPSDGGRVMNALNRAVLDGVATRRRVKGSQVMVYSLA